MTELEKIVEVLVSCIQGGNKVLVFGVGGNAANAIHFSAELAGKYEEYETPYACIDLCSNPSVLSAIGTDFGWEYVFERQVRGLAKKEDVVLAFSISTSGLYLLNGLKEAYDCGAIPLLICGRDTSDLLDPDRRWHPHILMELHSLNTPKVQERQLELVHLICQEVKSRLSRLS